MRLLVAAGTLVLIVPFLLTYGFGLPWWRSAEHVCTRQELDATLPLI